MHDEISHRILNSNYRAKATLPVVGTLNDALSFGFSFIESHDHFVEYVVAHPSLLKRIFAEISESELDPTSQSIGKLWTARMVASKKLKDDTLVFSNGGHTAVLFLNINPNNIGE